MKYRLHLYLLLVFFLESPAQKDGEFFEKSLEYKIPFTTTQYSTKNGLIQNQVIAVESTPGGLLFLSTGNGIYTFNGYDLKEIAIDKEYRKHFFHYLLWDEKHKILLGYDSQDNLCQILPELKVINVPGKNVMHITAAHDTIFVGTRQGEIFSLQLPALGIKKLHAKLPFAVNCLLKQGNSLYIGSQGGLYIHNLVTGATEKQNDEIFTKLKVNPYSGELYGITNSKVFAISRQINEKFAITLTNAKDYLSDIEFVNRHEFYLSSGKGLYHYLKGKVLLYTTTNALASNVLHCMFYNRHEKCLFVGTTDKGLMKLQFKNAFSLYKNQGLSESSAVSIIKTHDGRIIFAEICCNIYELKKDTIINYNAVKSYYSVLAEIDGSLLCGTWGEGLLIIKNNAEAGIIKSPNLPDNTPDAIYKDRRGFIWVGTMKGLARGRSLSTLKPFLLKEISGRVNTIYELKNGDLCLGGPLGAWIVSGDKVKKELGKKEGLISNAVRSFYEDQEGKLWIGTYGGGLYCYEGNNLTSINSKKGCMLFEDAFCLAPDALGNLYMTSNYGLWSVQLKALDDFYKNKTSFLVPAHYTEENGLLNTEFNGGFQNNYLQDKKNHFYFPSVEGILDFNSDTLPSRKLRPVIESVTVNDSSTSTNSGLFARNTFLLKFKVSCVNFSGRNNVYFQYKLSGGNLDEWSTPQKENFFNFYLLPPGDYNLAIRAIDAYNDHDPLQITYGFTIQPYFYETLWFKVLGGILFVALVTFIGIARVRLHQKKAAEKEFYGRRIAEIELKAVQAQLNPHFIFNCLNTIKYFILDHDFEKANKGLNHFSKLLRDVLHNSERLNISLNDKIKFLTGYLELEKMRLQEQLEYTITSDIENSNIQIPTMIIQLYVENAIKHGISHLEKRKGLLHIHFTRIGDYVQCTITDNGIGRTASSKINILSEHRSVGIRLITDQTDILKKIHNIEIVTDITDLHNEDNIPAGTQVTIKIPIQHDSSDH